MDISPSDALAASVFAVGAAFDFVRREDIVRWADRRIAEMDQPPIWLIDLSLSQNLNVLDLISLLKRIGSEAPAETTCHAVYALLPDASRYSFDQAETTAKLVYRITRECLNGDWSHLILGETDDVADTFAFVRDGFMSKSPAFAVARLNDFVGRFRNEDVVKSLAPVRWTRIPDESPALSKESSGLVCIGVDSWIIQDGNYGDFAVGDVCKFALEFYAPDGLKPAENGPAIAEHFDGSRYRIRAKVIFANQNVWVIESNHFAIYCEQKPPPFAMVGAWVEGIIYLGIDPFFYIEYLHRLERMPPLTYAWRVRQIMRDTTLWIELKDIHGHPYQTRDESRTSFVPTHETKAWDEDGGNAAYVLKCERVGGPDKPAS